MEMAAPVTGVVAVVVVAATASAIMAARYS
jgi:hypothetical protein